jgi:hypothetical protein
VTNEEWMSMRKITYILITAIALISLPLAILWLVAVMVAGVTANIVETLIYKPTWNK